MAWLDQVQVDLGGETTPITVALADTNSANWDDATPNTLGLRYSTIADTNSSNWAEPSMSLLIAYDVTLLDDDLNTWSDAGAAQLTGVSTIAVQIGEEASALWQDAVSNFIEENLQTTLADTLSMSDAVSVAVVTFLTADVADDNSGNWSDGVDFRRLGAGVTAGGRMSSPFF